MWKELSVAGPYLLTFFPKVSGVAEYLEYQAKPPAALQLNYIAAVSICSRLLLRIDQYLAKNTGLILHSFIHCELVLYALCNTRSCSCGLGAQAPLGAYMPFACKQQRALQGLKALGLPMEPRTSVLFPALGASPYVEPLLPRGAACSSLKSTCPLSVNPCPSVCRALSALINPRLPRVSHAQLVVSSDDVQVERPWLFQVLLTVQEGK